VKGLLKMKEMERLSEGELMGEVPSEPTAYLPLESSLNSVFFVSICL
jgi:hypothetical protein